MGDPRESDNAATRTYLVARLVDSVIHMPDETNVNGLSIQTLGGYQSRETLAWAQINAPAFAHASAEFDRRLLCTLDAMSIELLAPVSALGASSLIWQRGSSYLVFSWIEQMRGPRVTFSPLQKATHAELEMLVQTIDEDPDARGALSFFRESLLTASIVPSVIHLIRAAEALAGDMQVKTCPLCKSDLYCRDCDKAILHSATNRTNLKKILGDELHGYFYRKPGIRHRLMHGRFVDPEPLKPLFPELQASIRGALEDRLKLHAQLPFETPRGGQMFRTTNHFLEPIALSIGPTLLPMLVGMAQVPGGLSSESDPRLVDASIANQLVSTY